ncbi:MAG: Gfo/Idh/MocA family oxidoreductase [Eubacterium sp.]
MKKMNVGLVGAGFMGKAHCVAMSNMPKLFPDAPYIPVFKTVCDIVPEIAKDFAERFSFENYCTDWNDIVNDPEIDIVCVCTPNNVHAPVSIVALNAGTCDLQEHNVCCQY